MVFTKEYRILIKILRQEKQYCAIQLIDIDGMSVIQLSCKTVVSPALNRVNCCGSNMFTRIGFTMWNTRKTLSLKSGVVSHRESLTKPSRNGMFSWGRVFENNGPMAILSTNCRSNCESNVCYDWHIDNISVVMLFFKHLYLINRTEGCIVYQCWVVINYM